MGEKKPKRIVSPGTVGDANLRKARFFLGHVRLAERAEPFDPAAVEAYLAAAIVFGKATQDWMADKYGGKTRTARKAWLKGTSLWGDPLCELFAQIRDILVHEDGSVEPNARTSVTVYASAGLAVGSGGIATVRITPTNPPLWQRVKLRWKRRRDLANARRRRRKQDEEVRRIIAKHRAEAEIYARAYPAKRTTRAHFTHSDPLVTERPAVDVVRDYLDRLERVLVAQQPPSATQPEG